MRLTLERMINLACALPSPAWLGAAARARADMVPREPRLRAIVPIWRRPWMVFGSDTFAGDLLARLGHRQSVRRSSGPVSEGWPGALPWIGLDRPVT